MVQYYTLIKTKIIILTKYVVMKELLDEYYSTVFGFVVNKVPSPLKWFSIYCSCNQIQSEIGGLLFGTHCSEWVYIHTYVVTTSATVQSLDGPVDNINLILDDKGMTPFSYTLQVIHYRWLKILTGRQKCVMGLCTMFCCLNHSANLTM